MQVFRVCTLRWSTFILERACVAKSLLYNGDMDVHWKLLTKVQYLLNPQIHMRAHVCADTHKHTQTWTIWPNLSVPIRVTLSIHSKSVLLSV